MDESGVLYLAPAARPRGQARVVRRTLSTRLVRARDRRAARAANLFIITIVDHIVRHFRPLRYATLSGVGRESDPLSSPRPLLWRHNGALCHSLNIRDRRRLRARTR